MLIATKKGSDMNPNPFDYDLFEALTPRPSSLWSF